VTKSAFLVVFIVLLSGSGSTAQQLSYSSGQRVVPAYEGWEKNPDGSFNLLFGYMNQNWDEEIDIPVGPDNDVAPGPADQGQPTHLLPRRNRFVFKIRVPADFGTTELTWTLASRGRTVKAYGSLKPDYFLEPVTMISEKGGIGGGGGGSPEVRANKAPVLTLEGETLRSIKVGQPLMLIAAVNDDGVPRPRRQSGQNVVASPSAASAQPTTSSSPTPSYAPPRNVTVNSAVGLRVSWYVYRGRGKVSFDPPQIKVWEDTREGANSPWAPRWMPPPLPPDGRIMVHATFAEPGTYVLRCLADDGGLWDDEDVTVTVTP
jgi:hypothetical protein